MKDYCNKYEILTLHTSKIKSFKDLLLFLMPFTNEFASLFTITLFIPYFNLKLYSHHPKSLFEIIMQIVVNIISLVGILYVSLTEYESSKKIINGIILGLLYIVFAYTIPNYTMEKFLGYFKGNINKLILGLIFIYVLDLIINILMCLLHQ